MVTKRGTCRDDHTQRRGRVLDAPPLRLEVSGQSNNRKDVSETEGINKLEQYVRNRRNVSETEGINTAILLNTHVKKNIKLNAGKILGGFWVWKIMIVDT